MQNNNENEHSGGHVLDVNNYSLSIKKGKKYINILNGMDFYIDKGEVLGVVGESGCGKSMTALSIMHLINGETKTEGSIMFNGKNILNATKKEMLNIRGNEISMIFQEPMTSLNPVLTIGEQLSEVFMAHSRISKKMHMQRHLMHLNL